MAEPTAVVEQLLASMSTHEATLEAIRSLTAEDLVWSNTGLPDCVGREAVLAMVEGMHTGLGAAGLKVEILNIAANGGVVLTERVDRFLRADGSEIAAAEVMGTFEVRDGKVTAWRDYFDLAGFMQKVQATVGG
ncbi:MAG TPA: limonene-1,2-epoxide hydrolase family protein [Mycobacteriales bacterium]|nr:limonene-1,2-epoxide hydrolase family protein [Mycobacteriales bacterium]